MNKTKLLGIGNTAEVFEYGNGKVCKLFFDGYPNKYIKMEFQNAKEIYKNGIRIPKPFQIITIENRTGIVYEKIEGNTLLKVMIENVEIPDELLDMFVNFHLDIIAHHSKNILSYKEYLVGMLKNKKINDQVLFDRINSLPDDSCILHGDFHPDNVIIRTDGVPFVIDFMNVCYGPYFYDIARTYFLIKQFDDCLADKYLKKMGVLETDISGYLDIIELCRKYEGE